MESEAGEHAFDVGGKIGHLLPIIFARAAAHEGFHTIAAGFGEDRDNIRHQAGVLEMTMGIEVAGHESNIGEGKDAGGRNSMRWFQSLEFHMGLNPKGFTDFAQER